VFPLLLTCHLTKLETAVEQVRKAYPKLRPTDVALLASALALSGRHALASYGGENFAWPEDYEKLTKSLAGEIEIAQPAETKKASKSAPEEEPVVLTVGLVPNFSAGEKRLVGRKDLLKLFSAAFEEGVEYAYSATDVGWQWALDRANWSTISGGELSRRVKVKAVFSEGAVGVEMGSAKKKRTTKKKAEPEPEPVAAE
jgi:hypothetical protein